MFQVKVSHLKNTHFSTTSHFWQNW